MEGMILKLKLQYFGHLMWKLSPWKRPWCWERLKVGGEGDNRGWDGWMASPIWWTWVWANSRSWWWTRRPGVLQSMGSQRVGHNWATELNWVNEDPTNPVQRETREPSSCNYWSPCVLEPAGHRESRHCSKRSHMMGGRALVPLLRPDVHKYIPNGKGGPTVEHRKPYALFCNNL